MKIFNLNYKVFIVILSVIVLTQNTGAQTLTFSEDIAPIIYNNCTKCHRTGGIAPFPLESYTNAFDYRFSISFNISNGIMPPWPPDTTFQRYAHERILTQNEIDAIVNWVGDGAPEGDSALAPPAPVFAQGSVLGTPDLKLTIPTYNSPASLNDVYKCFFLPTGLGVDKYIKAIEVVPGNRAIVHHALVYMDTTATVPGDSSCNTGQTGAKLLTGYTPGAEPTVFPNGTQANMGIRLVANSNIVIQIHYPLDSIDQVDSTSVNLFFYPDSITNVREVSAAAILQNWSLSIPPDTVMTYTAQYPPGPSTLPADFSLLSVFPHMHLLGTSMVAYAVTATNDTIPLSRTNNWDFQWQGFYNFKKVLKLPTGSKLYAEAVYDNTVNNPNNPNSPPQLVVAGEATTDEMFLIYFHFLTYEPGDENIILSEPKAVFTANSTTVFFGDTVTFTDQSTYSPTSWSWFFPGAYRIVQRLKIRQLLIIHPVYILLP